MHADIDGATFAKWLRSTVTEWQAAIKPGVSDALYISPERIRNIGAHSPRISFAAVSFDKGCDVVSIMHALDHKSTQMTIRYILQSERSANGRADALTAMARGVPLTGPRSSESSRAPQGIASKSPDGVNDSAWRRFVADRKKFRENGYIEFQCPHCVADYDERRYTAFATHGALKKHLDPAKGAKCPANTNNEEAKSNAKAIREALERANMPTENFLGTVEEAKKKMDSFMEKRRKKNEKKKRKLDAAGGSGSITSPRPSKK